MARKAKTKKKAKTAIEKKAHKFREAILSGSMLCVDPSSGSKGYRARRRGRNARPSDENSGSLPGWALFKCGKLVDSGVIDIPKLYREAPYRLQDLAKALNQFEVPDLLVVERVGKGVSLVMSAGAIFASVLAPKIIRIHPRSWQKWVRPDQWTRATKSDENDAKAMGYALINMLMDRPKGDDRDDEGGSDG